MKLRIWWLSFGTLANLLLIVVEVRVQGPVANVGVQVVHARDRCAPLRLVTPHVADHVLGVVGELARHLFGANDKISSESFKPRVWESDEVTCQLTTDLRAYWRLSIRPRPQGRGPWTRAATPRTRGE